jgi:hypothetical protein
MFYNKEIEVLGYEEGITNDYGIYVEGSETVLKTLKADVQPITKELSNKMFGYNDDVKYQVFCDVDNLIGTGAIIKYNDNKYKIMEIMKWDNYYHFVINDWK